jgi:predicted RNase H-like nuclease (RuvC/YqgF family)
MSDTPRPLDSESEVNGRIRQLENELAAMTAERDHLLISNKTLARELEQQDEECAELRKENEELRKRTYCHTAIRGCTHERNR